MKKLILLTVVLAMTVSAVEAKPSATKPKLTHGDLVVMVERCIDIESCTKVLATINTADVTGIKPEQLSKYFDRLNKNISNITSRKLDPIHKIEQVLIRGRTDYWPCKWDDRLRAAEFDVDQLKIIQEEAKSILESLNKGEKFWDKRLCKRQKEHITELMSRACNLSALLLERALLCKANEAFAGIVKSSGSLASR